MIQVANNITIAVGQATTIGDILDLGNKVARVSNVLPIQAAAHLATDAGDLIASLANPMGAEDLIEEVANVFVGVSVIAGRAGIDAETLAEAVAKNVSDRIAKSVHATLNSVMARADLAAA